MQQRFLRHPGRLAEAEPSLRRYLSLASVKGNWVQLNTEHDSGIHIIPHL